jgi:hypothetical protein
MTVLRAHSAVSSSNLRTEALWESKIVECGAARRDGRSIRALEDFHADCCPRVCDQVSAADI